MFHRIRDIVESKSEYKKLPPQLAAQRQQLADELELTESLASGWDDSRSRNINFERFIRRQVLSGISSHLFWGLDEVDRLFTRNFGGQVFGMFRAWHNRRALAPSGPWSKLTLAIAYATEAHLFITDLNQSPFNVGTRLELEDFSMGELNELNQRYGAPLKNQDELRRFYDLLAGQPYLSQCAFHEMIARNQGIDFVEKEADREESIFGDHLRRLIGIRNRNHVRLDVCIARDQ
jgi:hypothetical protein